MSYFKPRYLFPGQHDDEQIYLVIRSHWLYLLMRLMLWMLLFGIYLLANFGLRQYSAFLHISQNGWNIINLIMDLYLLLILVGAFIGWVMYYLNVQIITNERIVEILQHSLVSHTVSELHLSRVQDITSEVDGILQSTFNFGNLYIQTAAEKERFVFKNVPDPTELEKLISELCDKLPVEETMTNQKHPQ